MHYLSCLLHSLHCVKGFSTSASQSTHLNISQPISSLGHTYDLTVLHPIVFGSRVMPVLTTKMSPHFWQNRTPRKNAIKRSFISLCGTSNIQLCSMFLFKIYNTIKETIMVPSIDNIKLISIKPLYHQIAMSTKLIHRPQLTDIWKKANNK